MSRLPVLLAVAAPVAALLATLVAACSEPEPPRAPDVLALVPRTCALSVSFDKGSAALDEAARIALKAIPTDGLCPDVRKFAAGHSFLVRGYAASIGSDEATVALSLRRAEVVRTYLMSSGIRSDRIQVGAYGDTDQAPVSSSRPADRVVVSIALDGKEQYFLH